MNKVYAIFLWFALLFCHNGLLAQNGGVIVTGKVYAGRPNPRVIGRP